MEAAVANTAHELRLPLGFNPFAVQKGAVGASQVHEVRQHLQGWRRVRQFGVGKGPPPVLQHCVLLGERRVPHVHVADRL